MKQFKLIGLTGQSGAGKSTVAKIFAENGAAVISADEIVAQLYEANSPCLKTLAATFGEDILRKNGTLNRKLLAQRAFASKENTALLGKLVHPFVTARLFELLKEARGLVIYDAPQLFEANAEVICDSVIAVVADEKLRRFRIIDRDNITTQQANARMNAQFSEEFFRANCDYIIENNGSVEALEQQAQNVLKKLKAEVD